MTGSIGHQCRLPIHGEWGFEVVAAKMLRTVEVCREVDAVSALSRHIFQAPTRFYKTGVVFMAYLNGHQNHFTMVGGQQSARSLQHLAELFRLADASGLLADPDLAAARMKATLAVHGVEG